MCFGLLDGAPGLHPVRIGAVAAVRPGQISLEGFDGSDHAAMIGVEVVSIQHVVLAGVLVLDRQVEPAQALAKLIGNCHSEVLATIGIASPFDVDLSQVLFILPVLGVYGIGDPSTVSSGAAAEDAVTRLNL